MSRLIFDADTLGGTTTLSSADAVGNFTLIVPAVNGTLSVKDASDDATFRNITLTGAVLAGAWNGSTIAVAYGGTGATTLTGYVKGNGTSAMTASPAIPNTDITGLGTMSTQGSDAVTITGGTANGLTIGAVNPAAGTFTTLRFNSTLSANGSTGTSGQVLTSNGASAPTWQNIAGTGTVTSVAALTLGTTGTDLSSTVANSTSTPVITLNVPTASATNRGVLSAADWTTFNSKGSGTVTSVAGTGTVNGLTLTGTVTSSGSLTLGGTLDLSSPPAIGGTTAAAGSFTTLNSSGATRLGGLSGNQSLQVNNVASAVNYLQVVGAVTAGSPSISALGTDTNINAAISAKGTGSVQLQSSGATVLNVSSSGTGVGNFINIYPTSGFLNWVLSGTDASIGYALTTKGSLGFYLSTGGGQQAAISNTASAVNYLNLTGAATTASPVLSALGSDTNVSLTLTPKGTGAVQVTGTGFSPNVNLTDAATIAWDTTTAGGQVATFTFVSSNRTMGAPTNLKNGAFYALAVIQNAGSNTLTWNSVFKWAAGTAPTLSTAAGAKDYFTFRSDGTNLYQQGISQAVA